MHIFFQAAHRSVRCGQAEFRKGARRYFSYIIPEWGHKHCHGLTSKFRTDLQTRLHFVITETKQAFLCYSPAQKDGAYSFRVPVVQSPWLVRPMLAPAGGSEVSIQARRAGIIAGILRNRSPAGFLLFAPHSLELRLMRYCTSGVLQTL